MLTFNLIKINGTFVLTEANSHPQYLHLYEKNNFIDCSFF